MPASDPMRPLPFTEAEIRRIVDEQICAVLRRLDERARWLSQHESSMVSDEEERRLRAVEPAIDAAVRIDALVLCNGHMTIEAPAGQGPFAIEIIPGQWAVFTEANPATYVLERVCPSHAAGPVPRVSGSHVLWRRQVAIEADRAISAYRQGLQVAAESESRSGGGGLPHAA